MAQAEPKRDKWADWLVRGRQRGLSDRHVREMHRHLNTVRNRVLTRAKLRAGDSVLDVGAGTGLLALAAQARVGESGRVVACDISHDALSVCRTEARAHPVGSPIAFTVGDARSLPFADETFDVVMTRSVLIYLHDKPRGVRELFRVVRPGGRVSIFEPINDVWRTTVERLRNSGFYDDFQPAYDRLLEQYAKSESSSLFLGWDEKDLLRWFEDAGFAEVTLTYEHVSTRTPAPKRVTAAARAKIAAQWQLRPNPHDPSFEETVRSILGDGADDFLSRFLDFLARHPAPSANAVAYISARR